MPNPNVTPERIRNFLLDRKPEDNFLLDDVEMDSESIQESMRMVVDMYETVSPFLSEDYDINTFPYSAPMVIGTAGYLLRSKGFNLLRNRLPHQSASGTAVDDKQRAEAYIKLGSSLIEECKDMFRQIKQHINIESGYLYLPG